MKRYGWIAAAVIFADQLTKLLARGMSAPMTLIPGVLGLRLCENTGMAFSLLSGMPWLLGLMSLGMILVGAAVLRRYRLGRWSRIAAMMMLGGAAGNMIDRLARGAVTDMIEVLAFRFAVFNVADMALTVGCGVMALTLLLCPRDWETKQPKKVE